MIQSAAAVFGAGCQGCRSAAGPTPVIWNSSPKTERATLAFHALLRESLVEAGLR